MRILHIIGGNLNFGASKGALILHKALLNEGVDSYILNDNKLPKEILNADTVKNYFLLKIFNFFFVFIEKIFKRILAKNFKTTFTMNFLGVDIKNIESFKKADIIHLHWLNQGFIDLNHLKSLNKPIVWTLRDMWAFTGGCHYSLGCKKFTNNCGSCHILNSSNMIDISSKIQKKKEEFILSNKKLYVTTISSWLADLALQSKLFGNLKILPMGNNVEINNFYPIGKNIAREMLNIKTKKKILIYGSQNPQDERKGWNILLDALKKIDKTKYFLVIFGNFWSSYELKKIGIEFKSFGYVNNENKLRKIYSSGDIYLAPAIEDGWPKSFGESMLCGTPVLSFKNTSIGEVITNNINGFTVKNFDSNEYKLAIDKVTNNIEQLKIVSENGRKLILNNFTPDKIAKKYVELYKEILN